MFANLAKRNLDVLKKTKNGLSVTNICSGTRSKNYFASKRLSSSLSSSLIKEKFLTMDEKEPALQCEEMLKYYPTLVEDLAEDHNIIRVPELRERFKRLLNFIKIAGRYQSAITVNMIYRMLENPENLTSENMKRSNMMAWCVIMLQTDIQINDDMVDNTTIRNDIPCWYTLEDVGLNVVNDSAMLKGSMYYILKKYMSSTPNYVKLFELFTEHSFKWGMGQGLDIMTHGFDSINMERVEEIRENKTNFTAFMLPFTMALYMSNRYNADQYQLMKPILEGMGKYPQIKNDYTDTFRCTSYDLVGGTDISQGKCTWMSATALERANPAQRDLMKKHFGKPEKESVEAIINLYNELDMHKAFADVKVECYRDLHARIENLPKECPRDVLFRILDISHNDNII